MNNSHIDDTHKIVKDYYGKELQGTTDLKTSACCPIQGPGKEAKDILAKIHPEILDTFYGCGSPIPPCLEGKTVLDLGCGTGRDVYHLSALVGESGHVIGVDMTDEQIAVAQKYRKHQAQQFGLTTSNVSFKKGYIEDLKSIGITDDSVDLVVSNCVINLSPDKKSVFSEIMRILKPGGELYFSDVFTGRRMDQALSRDPVLVGECLGGALYVEDFRRVMREVGCLDYRVVRKRRIAMSNPEIEDKAGMIDFYSMTVRAFKLTDLEDICEDYGQVATYLGTIPGSPHQFQLDDHHVFITSKPMLVCGNTASMLGQTRYAQHFSVQGDRSTHFGPFACGSSAAKQEKDNFNAGGACC